jgi:acetoin utilization protein AcuB
MRRHWIAASPHASLYEAERLMRLARVRQLPVAENGILVGLLSNYEVLLALLERLIGAAEGALLHELLAAMPVAAVMNPHPPVIDADARLEDAAERMIEEAVACLPVVEGDDPEHMVGLVVESDLLRRAYGGFAELGG